MNRPWETRLAIGIGLFTIVAMCAYWFAWFFAPDVVRARAPSDPDYAVYMSYEQAFPLPDLFVTLAAATGVAGLWRMRTWGLFAMLLAAGGAFFLGLEDLLYDLQHGMFTPFGGPAAIELAIVLVIMALGPLITLCLWRRRRDFHES